MEKVSFAKLNLKNEINTVDVSFNNTTIKVFQYLPVQDKIDLVNSVLFNSEEGIFYDRIKIEVYKELYMVYMYTNIIFTENQRKEPFKLYDKLYASGLLDKILEAIPRTEKSFISAKIFDMIELKESYNQSVNALVQNVITDLPKNAQAAADIVNNFDPEKYKEVVNFAKAAGANG